MPTLRVTDGVKDAEYHDRMDALARDITTALHTPRYIRNMRSLSRNRGAKICDLLIFERTRTIIMIERLIKDFVGSDLSVWTGVEHVHLGTRYGPPETEERNDFACTPQSCEATLCSTICHSPLGSLFMN